MEAPFAVVALAAVVSAALGLLGGVVVAARRARSAAVGGPADSPRSVIDSLVDVLSVLHSVAVVVDGRLAVVRATSVAYGLGLVGDGGLRHPELQALARRALETERPAKEDMELPRGLVGSTSITVTARAATVSDDHVLLLLEDRSERARVDEIRRDFVANVSHELKTPVGALSLLAETISGASDDPPAIRHFAGRMQMEAQRLSRLVQEIIELSRLQTVDALTSSELLDVDRLVRDAIDQARWRAESRQIDIDLPAPVGVRLYGDHDLLVTAIRNLLDNAINYSPPRTRISVNVDYADRFVSIDVTDRGHGIPLSEQGRIFERFYRVDPARSRETGGTGLGLSIVKHVAENHGGIVTVRSTPGEGATFTLRLPAAVTESSLEARRPLMRSAGTHGGAL